MNDNSVDTYICPRCGNEVKKNSRYCMKCGQVNLEHPDNQSFINSTHAENLVHSKEDEDAKKNNIVSIGNNNDFIICILFNYLLFFMGLIFFIVMSIGKIELSVEGILSSNISTILVVLSGFSLYFYAFQRLFIKINRRWWESFIPIYNIMVLSDVIFNKKILGLLILIPIVGEIYLIVLLYQLCKKFDYNGLLTVLLFPIYILLIAYGSHFYQEYVYESIEKEYKNSKRYFVIVMFFFIIGLGLFLFKNISNIEEGTTNIEKQFYVNIAKKIVKKVKQATDDRHVICNGIDYRKEGYSYMLYFSDVSYYVHVPFAKTRDVVSAYVLVTFINEDNIEYEVSLNDGVKMIEKVKIEDLSVDKVISSDKDVLDYNYPNMCNII